MVGYREFIQNIWSSFFGINIPLLNMSIGGICIAFLIISIIISLLKWFMGIGVSHTFRQAFKTERPQKVERVKK